MHAADIDPAGAIPELPRMNDDDARSAQWFRISAAGALALHATLLLATDGIHGGGDLRPHLRLLQQMAEDPALRTVYAPAYHALGSIFEPWFGLAGITRLFAFTAAAALIAGFRSFQRAAGLPDLASALFAWSPYAFSLTWCIPKIEAAGYALAFAGLGWLLRKRYLAAAAALAATFFIHTAAALVFGLCGGVIALTQRDGRALIALAAGSLAAAPLFGAHLAAGCRLPEAFLFSSGDYLRPVTNAPSSVMLARVAILAGPITTVVGAVGAPALWRRNRPVALMCATLFALYWNEIWLAPFGVGSTLNMLRGLTLLAFAVAIPAGIALDTRRRLAPWILAVCALWACATALWVVPNSCYTQTFTAEAIRATTVERCSFRWHNVKREPANPSAVAPSR
jgi:hypothetical protein